MSVLEDLKEKLKNIDEQIVRNKEIIKDKKQDIENLYHTKGEAILSFEEDLKKEIQGKIYENDFRFISILNVNKISDDGYLFGRSLDINFFNHTCAYKLFEKRDYSIHNNIYEIINENVTNNPTIIYDRIENEILKAFEYFLLSVKNHDKLIFIDGNSYECIINENIKYDYNALSLGPEYGIALECKRPSGKQIKRVKASDIDTNQVFYDFYKRSVEFCKDMFKDYLALHNASNI